MARLLSEANLQCSCGYPKIGRESTRALRLTAAVSSLDTEVATIWLIWEWLAPKGIADLLASKCVEHFRVPSIVLVSSGTKGIAVGSGRSVPGFDLEAELRSVQDLFERFGGHAQAIGLTIKVGKIGDLKQELKNRCRRLKKDDPLRPEADLALASVTQRFCEELKFLEPFGTGLLRPNGLGH